MCEVFKHHSFFGEVLVYIRYILKFLFQIIDNYTFLKAILHAVKLNRPNCSPTHWTFPIVIYWLYVAITEPQEIKTVILRFEQIHQLRHIPVLMKHQLSQLQQKRCITTRIIILSFQLLIVVVETRRAKRKSRITCKSMLWYPPFSPLNWKKQEWRGIGSQISHLPIFYLVSSSLPDFFRPFLLPPRLVRPSYVIPHCSTSIPYENIQFSLYFSDIQH